MTSSQARAERPGQAHRALDVGPQEGDRPGRQVDRALGVGHGGHDWRADPLGEGREHRHRGVRALAQDRLQALATDDQAADAAALGDDRRGARALAQDGQLADVVARLVASG